MTKGPKYLLITSALTLLVCLVAVGLLTHSHVYSIFYFAFWLGILGVLIGLAWHAVKTMLKI